MALALKFYGDTIADYAKNESAIYAKHTKRGIANITNTAHVDNSNNNDHDDYNNYYLSIKNKINALKTYTSKIDSARSIKANNVCSPCNHNHSNTRNTRNCKYAAYKREVCVVLEEKSELTIKEALEFLEQNGAKRSRRSIDGYISKGKLEVRKIRDDHNREVNLISMQSLQTLKDELLGLHTAHTITSAKDTSATTAKSDCIHEVEPEAIPPAPVQPVPIIDVSRNILAEVDKKLEQQATTFTAAIERQERIIRRQGEVIEQLLAKQGEGESKLSKIEQFIVEQRKRQEEERERREGWDKLPWWKKIFKKNKYR